MSQFTETFGVKGIIFILVIIVGQFYLFKWRSRLKRSQQRPKTSIQPRASGLEALDKMVPGSSMSEDNSTQTDEIMFMFSGHAWEAHEVLGVGSADSDDLITKAYNELKAKVEKESTEILDLAYDAIMKARHS